MNDTSWRYRLAATLCSLLPPLVGQRVREAIYPRRLARDNAVEFTRRTQRGTWFAGNTRDHSSHPLAFCGYSTWRSWAIALAVCQPGAVIVEVGAHVGTETVGFAQIVGPTGRVIAFEPLPANLAALRHNITLNAFTHVEINAAAVSDQPGQVVFNVPKPHATGTGAVQVGASAATAPANTLIVDAVMLDARAEQFGTIALIALDVEGHELYALRGAQRLLQTQRPVLIMEAGTKQQSQAGASLSDLHALLQRADYRVYQIGRFGLTDIREPERQGGDWCALPTEQADRRHAINTMLWRCLLLPCLPGLNPLSVRINPSA